MAWPKAHQQHSTFGGIQDWGRLTDQRATSRVTYPIKTTLNSLWWNGVPQVLRVSCQNHYFYWTQENKLGPWIQSEFIRKIEWSWYIQSELIAGKKIASVWLWHRKLCLPILSAKSVMEGCHVTSCLQRGGNTLLYKQQSYDKLASPYYLLKYIN